MDAEIAEREGDVGGDLHIAISQEWTNISVKCEICHGWPLGRSRRVLRGEAGICRCEEAVAVFC